MTVLQKPAAGKKVAVRKLQEPTSVSLVRLVDNARDTSGSQAASMPRLHTEDTTKVPFDCCCALKYSGDRHVTWLFALLCVSYNKHKHKLGCIKHIYIRVILEIALFMYFIYVVISNTSCHEYMIPSHKCLQMHTAACASRHQPLTCR